MLGFRCQELWFGISIEIGFVTGSVRGNCLYFHDVSVIQVPFSDGYSAKSPGEIVGGLEKNGKGV